MTQWTWTPNRWVIAGLIVVACQLMADGWKAFIASVCLLLAIDLSHE